MSVDTIDLVIDLQYGSTGKGLLVGWLAENGNHDTIMTAWAPNAGHTYIDKAGRVFIHTMLANGIVGPHVKRVMMGPGSILNLDTLLAEIELCSDIIDGRDIGIFVHPNAAVVTKEDIEEEYRTMNAIGSTKKGVGAAMINKIKRNPNRRSVAHQFADHRLFHRDNVHLVSSSMEWSVIYDQARDILIEGAQGFGLSIQHGFYPYTTSRDITPFQILADCGVPFNDARVVKVFGTCRTYPIRVANRFDDEGNQIGYSGPCYSDQKEIEWSSINRKVELTTVTKLPRRLFSFSFQQVYLATEICTPRTIFLNFVNYLQTFEQFEALDEFLDSRSVNVIYGIGPSYRDVIAIDKHTTPKEKWGILLRHMGR